MRAFYLNFVAAGLICGAVLDRIAVVVGNDVITEGEVIDELRLDEFTASQPLDLGPQQRHTAAERLVDQQLIRQEMAVAHYQPPPATQADAMLRSFQQQHFRNNTEFRAALQKYDITQEQLKQHLLWQLAVIRFTDERFGGASPNPPVQSANRASTPPPPPSSTTPPGTSADRLAQAPPAPSGETAVDQQLNAWLQQARASTHIDFKKEAFQ
jgi:hypothetical protein